MNREQNITFGTLRKFLSRIDRLSICREETLEYKNYIFLHDVPEDYNHLYVYGIGMIESEFYEEGEGMYSTSGNMEKLVFLPCIEVLLAEKPRVLDSKDANTI